MKKRNVKITKREHAFKGFASICYVEILNSFNPELQLQGTESTIKSKLIELLTELKYFKFMATLILVFKKIKSEDKQSSTIFIQTPKQKELSVKVTLCVSINLYYNYSKHTKTKTFRKILRLDY